MFAFVAAIALDVSIKGYGEDTLEWSEDLEQLTSYSVNEAELGKEPVYCVVGEDSKGLSTVKKTLNLIKQPYVVKKSLNQVDSNMKYKALILMSKTLTDGDVSKLLSLTKNEVPLIIAEMPNFDGTKAELKSLLGIDEIANSYTQKGMYFVEGILLGGAKSYAETKTNAYKVSLNAKCKTFIRGYSESGKLKNQEQNVLLWRTYKEKSPIYVFNNTLLSGDEGMGCLVSVLASLEDIFVYPIVGSFSVTMENFPLGNEYDEDATRIFVRDTQGAMRDMIAPDLILLSVPTGIKYTFFSSGSGSDMEYWNSEMHKHKYTLYENTPAEKAKYLVTGEGYFPTESSELINASYITAMGLVHHNADIESIFKLNSQTEWADTFKSLSNILVGQSELAPWLTKETYPQMIHSVNLYYGLKPEINVAQDKIIVKCPELSGEASFLIRLKDQLAIEAESPNIISPEDGVYKVTVTREETTIPLVRKVTE